MKKIFRLMLPALLCLSLCACEKDNSVPPTPLSKEAPQVISVSKVLDQHLGSGTDGQYLQLSPVVLPQGIITVSYKGQVVYTNFSGQRVWEQHLASKIGASPASDGNLVVVGTLEGGLTALTLDQGAVRWTIPLSAGVLAAPVISGDVVVVHLHDDSVQAFNLVDGHLLWVFHGASLPLTLPFDSSPNIVGQQVVVGLDSGILTVLNLQNGEEVWSRPVALQSGDSEIARMVVISGQPRVDSGVIYAAAYHGNIVGLNFDHGDLVWEHPSSVYQPLALGQSAVFATNEVGDVIALDRATGKVLWTQKGLEGRSVSAPVLIGADRLAVSDYAGYVHFISPQTGAFLARVKVGSGPITAPMVALDGRLYLYTDAGRLVVLT